MKTKPRKNGKVNKNMRLKLKARAKLTKKWASGRRVSWRKHSDENKFDKNKFWGRRLKNIEKMEKTFSKNIRLTKESKERIKNNLLKEIEK